MSVFTIRQAHEELELVWKFQRHAQLSGVRMKGFGASSAEKEPEVTDGLQLDLKHSVPRAGIVGNSAFFDVKLDIEALADKDPAKMLFHVDCCFELSYTLAPDYHPTESELEAFQKGNAVFHCWPYMREFVQNATQRMGLSVSPIPLLRLEPLPPSGAGEKQPAQALSATARKRAPRRVKPAERS